MAYQKKSFQALDRKPREVKATYVSFKEGVKGKKYSQSHYIPKLYTHKVIHWNETESEIYLSFIEDGEDNFRIPTGLVSLRIVK